MTKTEYTTDDGLDRRVKEIIEKSAHPALHQIRQQELKIVPVMKIRTTEEGEHEQNPGPPAKVLKVNDMWKLFTDAHYILEVDYYFFNNANCVDAVIFNTLCAIDVKTKDGEIKLATKKPDIQVFAATLQVYGAFDDMLLGMREWMNTAKTKAAKSFADKVSTGKLEPDTDDDDGQSTSTESDDEEPPRVHSGTTDDQEAPRSRSGRTKR